MLAGRAAMSARVEVEFPPAMRVVRLNDVSLETVMFPVNHPYVETLWLPVIGPSATWALRRLGAWATACPGGVNVILAELGGSLGLGWASGRNSSVQRSLRRLVMFGLAHWTSELAVATAVPPLADRQLRRLAPSLVRVHDRMTACRTAVTA